MGDVVVQTTKAIGLNVDNGGFGLFEVKGSRSTCVQLRCALRRHRPRAVTAARDGSFLEPTQHVCDVDAAKVDVLSILAEAKGAWRACGACPCRADSQVRCARRL